MILVFLHLVKELPILFILQRDYILSWERTPAVHCEAPGRHLNYRAHIRLQGAARTMRKSQRWFPHSPFPRCSINPGEEQTKYFRVLAEHQQDRPGPLGKEACPFCSSVGRRVTWYPESRGKPPPTARHQKHVAKREGLQFLGQAGHILLTYQH